MTFIFGGITLICFLGSLSMFTSMILWKDITYLFRRDKKGYLIFSNKYRGTYLFIIGLISLVCLLLTFWIEFKTDELFIFLIFFCCLGIGRVSLEMNWMKRAQKNKLLS